MEDKGEFLTHGIPIVSARGRPGRYSRLRRMAHRLRDERKLSARDWRQEMLEEVQEETIDHSQRFGDR